MSSVEQLFSEDDRTKIRQAVEAAERRTRGEIVPMIVMASGRYREAQHRAGLLLTVLTLAGLIMARSESQEWTTVHPGWTVVAVLGAYLVGLLLGRQRVILRFLIPGERMAEKVRLRAQEAFFAHGLHRTRDSTGVLILLSLLEQRVQILADRAIDQRVPPGTWDAVVQQLIEGVRAGKATDALCQAIETCGALLARYFPATEDDNPNELADDVLMKP